MCNPFSNSAHADIAQAILNKKDRISLLSKNPKENKEWIDWAKEEIDTMFKYLSGVANSKEYTAFFICSEGN